MMLTVYGRATSSNVQLVMWTLAELGLDENTVIVFTTDNGTAAEELAADYKAEGLEIGFNANYLKDILGQIDSDMVELHLADAGAPTLIRENEKARALYVLMPMRV